MAKEEEPKKEDSVIGMLVTIDEKEVGNYYKKHRNEIENQAQYEILGEDRIYLKSDTATILNEDGEEAEEWSYTFPKLNGLYSFNVHILNKKDKDETYTENISYAEGLYQIKNSTEKDNDKEIKKESLEATIYMNLEEMQEGTSFYFY